jgi:phage FluMu protein Com
MVEKKSTKKLLENIQILTCNSCNYTTCKKSSWLKHLSTDKHLFKKVEKLPIKIIKCEFCNKIYKDKSGLWYHSKKCKSMPITNDIILEMVKQNQEFKELLLETNKKNEELTNKLIEVIKEPKCITNNNTTNNKFNLNFFLNEQCKDALNITDFVSSLALKLSELEQVGQIGYVEGISKIFIRELDVYKRPIHCSDIKREVLYIKDENNWEKDNEEKEKMKTVINKIAHKNIQNIPIWAKENPQSLDLTSGKNDEYLQIINESMGGENEVERDQYMQKIIKNVAKEIIIDK